MFDWLRRVFGRSDGDERQQSSETIDALNAEAGGRMPVTSRRLLGRIKVRSGTLVLCDPQYVPGLEVSNITAGEVEITASFLRYPSGAEMPTELTLNLGGPIDVATPRKVGEVGIDSAKLIVADKADVEEHWTDIGKDRIGVISTLPDDSLLRLLTKRFKLKTRRLSGISAQVVGPVSDQLEAEIKNFLESDPRYAEFPFRYFRVRTNNSFDRANNMDSAWQFMPVGNNPDPLMFVCRAGYGDGCYDVQGQFVGEVPRVLNVNFVED